MRFRRLILGLLIAAGVCCPAPHASAQRGKDDVMSDAEVEKLREAAYVPVDRINVYIKIIDERTRRVQDLVTKQRHPGREQQLHDLLDQVSGIASELNDNLDEYSPKHRDVRKALPKLLEATERWSTALRAAPPEPAYKVVQRLALDAVRDVHEAAAAMQTEQVAYFKAHPEAEKAEKDRMNPVTPNREVIDIPR